MGAGVVGSGGGVVVTSVLRLRRVSLRSSGAVFKCRASNVAGAVEMQVQVVVRRRRFSAASGVSSGFEEDAFHPSDVDDAAAASSSSSSSEGEFLHSKRDNHRAAA